jgi:hypothetical protein
VSNNKPKGLPPAIIPNIIRTNIAPTKHHAKKAFPVTLKRLPKLFASAVIRAPTCACHVVEVSKVFPDAPPGNCGFD